MKKKNHLCALLSLLLLLSVMTGCGNGSGSADTGTTGTGTEETAAPAADPTLTAWLSEGFIKVKGDAEVPKDAGNTITLYAAKNEKESCQLSMLSIRRVNGLSVERTSGDHPGITVELFWQNVQIISGKEWPDALSPMKESFYLRPDAARGVLISFDVGTDAGAGDYTYTFALKQDGKVIGEYTVTLHVWDFAYPETPSMVTAIGIDRPSLAYHYGLIANSNDPITPDIEEQVDALYKQYYDYLLENKMSGLGLPYDILDDRADAYMSDPRVTGIYVSHEADDDTLVRIFDKLKSDPVWMEKAYMYPLDEPTSVEMLNELKEKVTHLRGLCPEMRFATSFFMNVDYDGSTDQIGFLADVLDILCIKTKCWRDSAMYSESQANRYPTMTERTKQLQAAGETVWSYVCWEPGYPYTNLFVNEAGVDHRVLFWQQYDVGSQGFLYWDVNFWKLVSDPWTSMATVPWLDPYVYGDGALLYNGNEVGVDGPCSSKRFEAVRDGIEDYELLKLAEETLGREWLDERIDLVTKNMVDYTASNSVFARTRAEIGNAVEAKLGS